MVDNEYLTRSHTPPGPDLDILIANEIMKSKLKPHDWCPAYSTDIVFTMEVLDQLKRRGRTIALRWWPPDEAPSHPDGMWTAHLGLGRFDVGGETLQHAVCLAAVASLYDK